MSDIVEELRSINKNYDLARGVHVDIRQAADRIEELEAQLEAVKDRNGWAENDLDAAIKENKELRAAIPVAYQMALEAGANWLEPSNERSDWTQYAHECYEHSRAVRSIVPPADLVEQATAKVKVNEND